MERLLTEIVEKLRKAHGQKLVSIVLYGSGATAEGRDPQSDYNVLCVLTRVTPDELREAEPIFRWWREMKNPAPLLIASSELRQSVDCFPMEFHDIIERHVVLHGENPVEGMAVDDSFYRGQVEHELRGKLFRLRQKAGGVLGEKDMLMRLLADSVSTFCVLFRHALRLAGAEPKFGKREVIAATRDYFGIDASPFDTILDLRDEKLKPKSVPDSVELLRSYLNEIGKVVEGVDRMKR
ncbi:MAG: hypothetical protein H7Y20_06280 [Bryobacteraceae bacterium]|nr:hypothetical protein [Bryobacteraceae bacterium]